MPTYSFLIARYSDDNRIYCINPEIIETLNLFETYDRNGQILDHESAGDYHPENSYVDFEDGDEENITECKGFSYFDGNNWKSIIVECDTDDACNYELISDEEEIERLNESIESKEFVKEGYGKKIYQSGDLFVIQSNFASSFAAFEIVEEYEL